MTASTRPISRTAFWYAKFVFACYGAGFGAAMLLVLAAMPFAGLRSALFERYHGVEPFAAAIFVFGTALAPMLWRRLR